MPPLGRGERCINPPAHFLAAPQTESPQACGWAAACRRLCCPRCAARRAACCRRSAWRGVRSCLGAPSPLARCCRIALSRVAPVVCVPARACAKAGRTPATPVERGQRRPCCPSAACAAAESRLPDRSAAAVCADCSLLAGAAAGPVACWRFWSCARRACLRAALPMQWRALLRRCPPLQPPASVCRPGAAPAPSVLFACRSALPERLKLRELAACCSNCRVAAARGAASCACRLSGRPGPLAPGGLTPGVRRPARASCRPSCACVGAASYAGGAWRAACPGASAG